MVCPNPPLAKVRTTRVAHWGTMWMECACWDPFASVDKVGAHIVVEDSSADRTCTFPVDQTQYVDFLQTIPCCRRKMPQDGHHIDAASFAAIPLEKHIIEVQVLAI